MRLISPSERIALAAEIACLLEVSAPKPGNVTRFADFSDTRYIDFLASAAVIGTVLRKVARATTGSLILEVVRETARAVGLCLGVSKLLGTDYAGVDLLRTHRGYTVVEVNSIPGWSGLQRTTEIDIAQEIADHLLTQLTP